MGDRAKKRERHRLKRLKKNRDARKFAGTSPLQRIANSGGTLECRVNQGFEEKGMVSIIVFGTAPGSGHALAIFLVDLWCVGLKDAWGQAQTTRAHFEDVLKRASRNAPHVPIDTDEARRLVVGACRFSRQNGFRLPDRWDKWVSIFGKLDIAAADLTGFGKDGGLMYVGDEKFLRKRLIGCTVEELLARPNFKYLMNAKGSAFIPVPADEADESHDDESDEEDEPERVRPEMHEVASTLLSMATRAAKDMEDCIAVTSAWCEANGVEVHPRLRDAAGYLSAGFAGAIGLGAPGDLQATADMTQRIIAGMIVENGEKNPAEIVDAMSQIKLAQESLRSNSTQPV